MIGAWSALYVLGRRCVMTLEMVYDEDGFR